MSEAAANTPPRWTSAKTLPVRLSIFFALVALGVRFVLPGSDPFTLYFAQFLQTGGQGRGHAAAARVAQLGQRGVEGLRGVLDNPESTEEELGAALQLIGEVGATKLAPRLLDFAAPGQALAIRLAALSGVGRMGGTSSLPVLLESLADPSPGIRTAVLRAVGPAGNAKAGALIARVEALASEGTDEERPEALAALGRIHNEQARAALWRLYTGSLPVREAIAARRALAGFAAPDGETRARLIQISEGYLPVVYDEPSPRARDRLEVSLRTLLALRIEDILLGGGEGTEVCENDEACAARNKYYRDLIRRRSTLEISGDAFVPLRADTPAKAEPLVLVRVRWLVGGSMTRSVRHQSLSLVRMIGEQPAIFPIQEIGYATYANAAESSPELGDVVRASGRLGANSLVVTLALPTMGVLSEERYRFEGGVFVPVGSGEL